MPFVAGGGGTADGCCQLVGNLDLGIDGCFISVSTNCSTEIVQCGDSASEGPSTGTINLSAYADNVLWDACPSKAGVSVNFMRKYDCDSDSVYFIFAGQGQSFYTGEADRYVSLNQTLPTGCTSINASSSSGPAAIYAVTEQVNGFGLRYDGDPISFTTTDAGTSIYLGGIFDKTCYLQSFSFDATPGQFPVVSYSFVHSM